MTDTLPSVSALLAQLIDYAGLFPPAKLAMDATARNYAGYVAGDDAWMLGRLVVPVSRLDELETAAADLLPRGGDDEPWHISGLTPPAGDGALPASLERIERFNVLHAAPAAGLARIDVIELRGDSAKAIEGALDVIPDEIYPFFEIPVDEDPRGLLATLVGSDAGAKVRTGGVTADLYPTAEQVARFIHGCAGAGVPFKATAGMHHPIRHYGEAVQTKEFGFINVFAAAAAGFIHSAGEAEIQAMLEEEDAATFRFVEQGLGWREQRITVEELERARDRFAISFGSCSFDEPREDLRALGLM